MRPRGEIATRNRLLEAGKSEKERTGEGEGEQETRFPAAFPLHLTAVGSSADAVLLGDI